MVLFAASLGMCVLKRVGIQHASSLTNEQNLHVVYNTFQKSMPLPSRYHHHLRCSVTKCTTAETMVLFAVSLGMFGGSVVEYNMH